MGRLDVGDKAERLLRFMYGLVNPRILAKLATTGFTYADYEEGWKLMRESGKVRFDRLPPMAPDPTALNDLDQFENHWFPIADASLSRRFPAVRERMFLNLTQTEGLAVILSVGTFIERLDAMGAGDPSFGADAQAARQLLATRGLTAPVVDQAKALLVRLGPREVPQPEQVPPPEQAEEERAKAEADMWAWYLEWSEIARRVIDNRKELRQLGFLAPKGRGRDEPDAPDAEPTNEPAAPAVK